MNTIIFEWDEDKAQENLKKHKVGFEEAKSVLEDDFYALTYEDKRDYDEQRFLTIGMSNVGRVLVVIWTQRGEINRIISAFKADSKQRKIYAKR